MPGHTPRLRAHLAACLLYLPLAALAQPLELADVMGLEWASSPEIAPQGDRIAYVRNGFDTMRDLRRGQIWLIEVDSRVQRPLTPAGASQGSPRFSPDGSRLAWIEGTEAGAEVFVAWLDDERRAAVSSSRITQLPESPSSLTWSPDGSMLAFTMEVPARVEPMVSLPKPPEGAEWAKPAVVIDRLAWRADGAGMLDPAFEHLFVVPADGGTPRQLTDGDFDHGGPTWMPDGSAIVVSANRRENWDELPRESDLWKVPLDGGEMERLTTRDGPEIQATISPDGKRIAYVGMVDRRQAYQVMQAFELDLASGEIRELTADLDRSVGDLAWADDGRRLLLTFDDHGVGVIASIDRRGRLERLATGLGGTSLGRPYSGGQLAVNADGDVAFTLGSTEHPADIAVLDGRGRIQRLTHLNDELLGHRDLGPVERISVASPVDGTEIEGWLVLPPGAGEEPLPLLLEIHGGPHTAYGPWFSAEVQLYAAAGYAVLYMNPRGSTSYGEAFGNAIQNAYPGDDYHDLMAGVDAMIERGVADPDHLYVTGGSGGGVLTAWIVGTTDRFRAAVVAKPVINWQSFALVADGSNFFTRYWFPAMPWEAPEHYWERSPLSRVGNVTTPTMLLTGEADLRTPISESEQYYQALRLRGVDTVLVRIPGASHGIAARPSQLMTKVAHILAWFERHGGPAPDAEADTTAD